MRRLGALLLFLPLVLAATPAGSDRAPNPAGSDLIVHEWGTFTSVAGSDGRAVEWAPFEGPSDLPTFVTLLNPSSPKAGPKGYLSSLRATVRMETPVIFFYSPREQAVDVTARFPHGLITEWYPQGVVPPVPASTPMVEMNGGIAWNGVKVMPLARGPFPTEKGPSHYYAARETDAAPVQVGSQQEKFLFYRGLASFPVTVLARAGHDRTISVENTGRDDIGMYVLFENRGGRLGYRVLRDPLRELTLDRPALTGDFASLGDEVEMALTEHGLYPREAAAMIETWRDTWFKEGTRLFYIVPRAAVDEILPLEITPSPAEVVRVFVGRVEIDAAASRRTLE